MDAVVATREWLERFVIGLNLCPFAGVPFRKDQIRYVVEEGDTVEQLVNTLLSELAYLYGTPADQVETTLVIHPNVLLDFLAYNDFLGFADDLLEETGLTGVFQIASFHPDYRFEGESDDDPANYTNRSPFPMLHILREDSLSHALDRYPEPERIPVRNMALLRQMGAEEILGRYLAPGARYLGAKGKGSGQGKKQRDMNLEERLAALAQLGKGLSEADDYREAVIHRTEHHNPWFTKENQRKALRAIAGQMLDEARLKQWLRQYDMEQAGPSRTVGLVLAGNIPLVGFHDVLCVFVAGHRAMIKLSDKDLYLLPFLLKRLAEIDPRTAAYFSIVEQLRDFEAVIATGSNNSARYFEAYFGKYPHIIRRNRNAVAILDGNETETELLALGQDVFQYFGLGCRNVAKIYVPGGYDFEPLLTAFHEYREIINHSKYKNNFDYNYALFMLNKVKYQANGCIILTENPSLQSHIAGLYYEFYGNREELKDKLKAKAVEIQCIMSRKAIAGMSTIPFGKAQEPELWDYPDGVDTLQFLLDLK